MEAALAAEPTELCPKLQLLLALFAGVVTRSEQGVRQGLRLAATTLGDEDAEDLLRLLVRGSDPVARFWLANLDGPRKGRRILG